MGEIDVRARILKAKQFGLFSTIYRCLNFPGGSVVKNLPANKGGVGDTGSIPGSGRSLEKEMAAHSSILAWKIPETEQPGRLQSTRSQRDRHDRETERPCMQTSERK